MSQFLSEFLYSALLWGSLITGVLWWLRGRARIGIVRKLLWLPLFWFGLHTLNAWYGFLVPMSGRLVDADSGQPIPRVRVYANWESIPLSIWYNFCSGEQAHASDAEGRFAFRFVPYPSLVYGALARRLDPRVPGHIHWDKYGYFWKPLLGDMVFQHHAPGRKVSGESHYGCDGTVAPQSVILLPKGQVNRALLPGEEHPYEVLFREACIERQPWTFNNSFLNDLVRNRPYSQNWYGLWLPPPSISAESFRIFQEPLAQWGCVPAGGICTRAVTPELHDRLCELLSTERKERGIRP